MLNQTDKHVLAFIHIWFLLLRLQLGRFRDSVLRDVLRILLEHIEEIKLFYTNGLCTLFFHANSL